VSRRTLRCSGLGARAARPPAAERCVGRTADERPDCSPCESNVRETGFRAQLEGNKSRAIDFYEGDTLHEAALKTLIRAGVKHNLAKVKPARKKM
jgi:hypothetical protein